MADDKAVRDALKTLRTEHKKFLALRMMPSNQEREKLRTRLEDAIKVIESHIQSSSATAPTSVTTTTDETSSDKADTGAFKIQEFFQEIGEGARSAQEMLDLESDAYMRSRPQFAPDTMFRLPKVTANLRLGMEQSTEKGINFFLFKRSGEESQRIEQEISFEVVAAPPPPDAMELAADLPLGQVILSSSIDRDAVHKRLQSERARQTRNRKKLQSSNASAAAISAKDTYIEVAAKMLAAPQFRRVVIFGGGDQYLLVYVPPGDQRDEEQPEIGVKILTLPKDTNASLDVVAYDLAKKDTNPRTRLLIMALAAPVDRQAELLTQLNRT